MQARYHHFQSMPVHQSYEAQLLCWRNELSRADHRSVRSHYTQEAFMVDGKPCLCADNWLLRKSQQILTECSGNFIGRSHEAAPRAFALRGFYVGRESVSPVCSGLI